MRASLSESDAEVSNYVANGSHETNSGVHRSDHQSIVSPAARSLELDTPMAIGLRR